MLCVIAKFEKLYIYIIIKHFNTIKLTSNNNRSHCMVITN
jgi:hypothetical protein